jgi:hypothetical protein
VSKHEKRQSEDLCPWTEQVHRLKAMRGYPRDSERTVDMHGQPIPGDAELIRVARKYAPPGETLRKVVDRILEDWDKCPQPSELRKAIQEFTVHPHERDDKIRQWRKEFREELRKALLAVEQLGDCRERREWLDWLQYADAQHPDIVIEERARMAVRPEADALVDFTLKSKRPLGALEMLMGSGGDADYARLRRAGIRDALRATADSGNNSNPHSRQFWADHLAWAEREHADEVAALRAEPGAHA